jgi:hypothetical protein
LASANRSLDALLRRRTRSRHTRHRSTLRCVLADRAVRLRSIPTLAARAGTYVHARARGTVRHDSADFTLRIWLLVNARRSLARSGMARVRGFSTVSIASTAALLLIGIFTPVRSATLGLAELIWALRSIETATLHRECRAHSGLRITVTNGTSIDVERRAVSVHTTANRFRELHRARHHLLVVHRHDGEHDRRASLISRNLQIDRDRAASKNTRRRLVGTLRDHRNRGVGSIQDKAGNDPIINSVENDRV